MRGCTLTVALVAGLVAAPAIAAKEERGMRGRAALLHALHADMKGHHAPMADHMTRVAQHAERMALYLGLGKTKAKAIAAAGLLHDLGKRDMTVRVLNGLKVPDQAALDEIAKHPNDGHARLVASFPRGALRDLIAGGIVSHHEQMDGKGYPKQLSGQQIPIAARIVQVADAYDAMITPRNYNTPMTHEQAIARLREVAGWKFDPKIVEAFIASYQPASAE
jgi:HD-GYP domain-containing protein (c-di-GMP phosphodiesterase class II)